jgi:hypothetical protein
MKKTLLTLAAGLVLLFASSAFAQSDDQVTAAAIAAIAATTPSDSIVIHEIAKAPLDATEPVTTPPALLTDFIVVAPTQSGLPCFGCAPSPTPLSFSLGLSIPTAYITTGETSLQLVEEWETVTAAGSCTLGIAIMRGTKVLYTVSGTATVSANTIYVTDVSGVARKSYWHGKAKAIGTFACGASTATAQDTIFFQ